MARASKQLSGPCTTWTTCIVSICIDLSWFVVLVGRWYPRKGLFYCCRRSGTCWCLWNCLRNIRYIRKCTVYRQWQDAGNTLSTEPILSRVNSLARTSSIGTYSGATKTCRQVSRFAWNLRRSNRFVVLCPKSGSLCAFQMFSQSEFRFELCQFRVLEIESGQEWIHEAFDHIHLQAHQLLDRGRKLRYFRCW